MCFSLLKDLQSELILSSLQLVLCRVATVKHLPVHHHRADNIFSGPLGSLGSFGVRLKNEFRYNRCSGAWAVLHHYITAHEQTQNTKSAIFISLMLSLRPQKLHSELIWLAHCILVHSSSVRCRASPFVSLGVPGLFCFFYSIIKGTFC